MPDPRSLQISGALFLLGLAGCRGDEKNDSKVEVQHVNAGSSSNPAVGVLPGGKPETVFSLIPLISDPGRHVGASTVVSGFLVLGKQHGFLGGSDGSLYLGREDATMLLNNRVDVRFGPCRLASVAQSLLSLSDVAELTNRYATIRGTFEPPPPAASTSQVGTICGITSVTPVEDPREKRPQPPSWQSPRPAPS